MIRKQLELEAEKFRPSIKSIKFLGSGVKTRVGRVSGNNKIFRPNKMLLFVVLLAMVNGKFSTPQLSLEYMERGLRTAISLAELVEQPVVVTTATHEVVLSTCTCYCALTRGAPDPDAAGYPVKLLDPARIRIRLDPIYLDAVRIRPDLR